jgi:hypothetical protein
MLNDELSRVLQIVPAQRGANLEDLARVVPIAGTALHRSIEEKVDERVEVWAAQKAMLARSKKDLMHAIKSAMHGVCRGTVRMRVARVIPLGDIKVDTRRKVAVYRHNVQALEPGLGLQMRRFDGRDNLAPGVFRIKSTRSSNPIILPDGWDTGGEAVPGATALLVKERT